MSTDYAPKTLIKSFRWVIRYIVPGFSLTLLGLWHTINTIRSYFLKGPSNFTILHVGLLAASVYCQELFLLHFHCTDRVGPEGHYHWLLQLIVFASLMSALAETCFQTSLPAALALSISVVFQGCWFMNMGFMLWVPRFVPKGCVVNFVEGRSENMIGSSVTWESSEADFRARVLANLQFSWILSGILIFTAYTCLKFAGKCIPSDLSVEYEQRHSSRGAEVPIAINDFKEASTISQGHRWHLSYQ